MNNSLLALTSAEINTRGLLALAVVVVTARCFGWLGGRLGQPRVSGEILAGIALGPSLLGLVWPGALQYLFPPEVVSELEAVALLALVLFMFLVGRRLDLGELQGQGHRAVAISHTSIIVPMAMGALLGTWLQPRLAPAVDRLGFALFVGTAMSITAFPVLARILEESGMARSRLGVLVITCAAIDDVTAWCVLAVVVAIVGTSGAAAAGQVLVLAALFVGGAILVVRPLLLRRPPPALVPAVTLALLGAWATDELGIHAIFGAFIAGTVVPRPPAGDDDMVLDQTEPLTIGVLLPVFFAVVGLHTRIDLLGNLYLWGLTGLVLATAVVGKWGGAMVAARLTGERWGDAAIVGVLMNARGLTELVLLNVGRDLGVVPPTFFTIMVVMALITTAMTSPLLAWLRKTDRAVSDESSTVVRPPTE